MSAVWLLIGSQFIGKCSEQTPYAPVIFIFRNILDALYAAMAVLLCRVNVRMLAQATKGTQTRSVAVEMSLRTVRNVYFSHRIDLDVNKCRVLICWPAYHAQTSRRRAPLPLFNFYYWANTGSACHNNGKMAQIVCEPSVRHSESIFCTYNILELGEYLSAHRLVFIRRCDQNSSRIPSSWWQVWCRLYLFHFIILAGVDVDAIDEGEQKATRKTDREW